MVAVSLVTWFNSAGHNPPSTQGVQSSGVRKVGTDRASRVAFCMRCRAVRRPKTATGQAYRRLAGTLFTR